MRTPHILILVDDPILGGFLAEDLTADHHTVTCPTDPRAELAVLDGPVDALLLDLADATLTMIDAIRTHTHPQLDPQIPILVLNADGEEHHRIRLLDRGADDIVPTTTGYPELRARLTALLRRAAQRAHPQLLTVGALQLDTAARAVTVSGRTITLTSKEYALLTLLIAEPTRVFTREELARALWSDRTFNRGRTIDSHAARLRARLRNAEQNFIRSVWGVGYRLIDPA